MLAYEDFKIYHGKNLLPQLGIAFNLFFKKTQLLNTLSIQAIEAYVIATNDRDKIEILVACCLIKNDSDLQVIKAVKTKEFLHITQELEQAKQAVSFIQTRHVKEAFLQAQKHNEIRQKELNTELTLVRKILEIITLLKPNQYHAD